MEANATYPKPHRPLEERPEDSDGYDIEQYEGVLTDGRPFRAEVWWLDGHKGVTYIFSTRGLEHAKKDDILALLAASGEPKNVPPRFQDYQRYSGGLTSTPDARGEPMWFYSFHLGSCERMRYKEDGVWKTAILPVE